MRATFTSAVAKENREFECTSCGHRATALVVAVGEGAQSSLNAAGTAQERAMRSARAEIDRTLSIAACPKCGERDRGAVRRWWIVRSLPVFLTTVGIAFTGFIPMLFDINMGAKDRQIVAWVMTGIAVFIGALFFLLHVAAGWPRAKAGASFPGEP